MSASFSLREERIQELAGLIAAAMPPQRIEFMEATSDSDTGDAKLRSTAETAFAKIDAALPTLRDALHKMPDSEAVKAAWLAFWTIEGAHELLEQVWGGES